MVDKNVGNTGGLGGVFGLLHAINRGFSFAEARPWKPSLRFRLFTFLGNLINMLPTAEDLSLRFRSKAKKVEVEKRPSKVEKEKATSTVAH